MKPLRAEQNILCLSYNWRMFAARPSPQKIANAAQAGTAARASMTETTTIKG
jgi:hypothetical protein